MKNLITFLLILLSLSIYSQSEINGIGRFKIGMNISILDSLKVEGYQFRNYDKNDYSLSARSEKFMIEKFERKNNPKKMKESFVVYEKRISSNYADYGSMPLVAENKTFVIKYYNVADIDIDFLELSFYNDKLYKIHISDNLELEMALEKKYKFNAEQEKGKTITCSNAYRVVEYQESTTKNVFRNDSLKAYTLYGKSYYDCKEILINFFNISDICIEEEVSKMERKIFMDGYQNPNRDDIKALKKL